MHNFFEIHVVPFTLGQTSYVLVDFLRCVKLLHKCIYQFNTTVLIEYYFGLMSSSCSCFVSLLLSI